MAVQLVEPGMAAKSTRRSKHRHYRVELVLLLSGSPGSMPRSAPIPFLWSEVGS